MVSDQLSSKNNTGSGGALSPETIDSIVNLVELSNSELTLASGGESLPITGLLLDALLDLCAHRRPDLLEHSQRIGYLCAGIASELNWTRKWTNNLICSALLHELGTLTFPSPPDYCTSIGTSNERRARNISIDFLEATHGDSDLLEILSLSHNFQYRKHRDEETPRYVLQSAVALSAVRFFETCRILPDNPRNAPEILAALRTIYNTSEDEIEVLNALESWLKNDGDERFDASIFLPTTIDNDPETAEIVRETFQEILEAFRVLQQQFDSFFMLDGTGRFQIWSSKSEKFLGRSVRSMRNSHWSNEVVKYCNEEGFPFSDAQTPLYQTLTTGKPARLHLCMQDIEDRLLEVEVNAIPIIGRDQLMQAILEFHSRLKAVEEPEPEILFTASQVSRIASDLFRQFEEDPEQHPLPAVSFTKIDEFLARLHGEKIDSPQVESDQPSDPVPQQHSDSSIFSDEEEDVPLSDEVASHEHSDVLIESVPPKQHETEAERESPDPHESEPESEPVVAEEPEPPDYVLAEESDDPEAKDSGSEVLDDLLSRFDGLMTEVNEPEEEGSDLEVTDSTIISKDSFAEEPSEVFAGESFLKENQPEEFGAEESLKVEEPPHEDVPEREDLESPSDSEPDEPAIAEVSEPEPVDQPIESHFDEPVVEQLVADHEPEPVPEIEESTEAVQKEVHEQVDETPQVEESIRQDSPVEELSISETSEEGEPEPQDPSIEAVANSEIVDPAVEEEPEREQIPVETPLSMATHESEEDQAIEPAPEEVSAHDTEPAQPEVAIETPEVETPPEIEPVEETPVETPAATLPEPPVEKVETPAPKVAEKASDQVGHHDWEEYVQEVMNVSSPLHESIAVLLLEIDSVDTVSKEFGKQIVEDLMTECSRRLTDLCSDRELSCRYGAEQFTIACPGLDLKAAYKRGDQIRQLFEKTRFDVVPFKKLTVTIGVTVAESGELFDDLIRRSEFALSRAAKLGRNCCVALDSDEVKKAKQADRDAEDSRIMVNEFELNGHFDAMIASDMIVYKLGGFLYDLGAKLIKVDRKHVEMRVGAKRLLPYWGKNPDSQPVLVDLQLGENWDQTKTSKRAVSHTTLHVRIRPDGWIKDKKVFKERAEQVLRALKGYFAAK